MNYRGVCRVLGAYLYLYTLIIVMAGIITFYFQLAENEPGKITAAFFQTAFLCFAMALGLRQIGKIGEKRLFWKEGIVAVVLIWVVTSMLAAAPFCFSGALNHFVDGWFEATSMVTTTGATILYPKEYDSIGNERVIQKSTSEYPNIVHTFYGTVAPRKDPQSDKILTGVEALPKGLLFWRAFMQFCGGLGMVMLFVAILPALGGRDKILFRYESLGPIFTQLFPTVRQTAIALFLIYALINISCFTLLCLTNENLSYFDAMTITFSAVSTGGLSTKNASIEGFGNLSTEVVVMVFMILGSINFALYYDLYRKRLFRLFDPAVTLYVSLLFLGSLFCSLNILHTPKMAVSADVSDSVYSFSEAIRYGFFQVISCMTTTGFTTANYNVWPYFSQVLLLSVMFLGGMAGSTSGGLKSIRVCILLETARHQIRRFFAPNQVDVMRVGTREIDLETSSGVLSYFFLVVFSGLIGLIILVLLKIDLETALSLMASMLNNAGTSFRMAGPTESCAFLSYPAKVVCIAWMFLGRLEFFVFYALLVPHFWKRGA